MTCRIPRGKQPSICPRLSEYLRFEQETFGTYVPPSSLHNLPRTATNRLTVPDDTRRSDSGRADAARRTDLTGTAGRTTAVPSTATTATAGPTAGGAADVPLLNAGNATLTRFC